MFEAGFGTKVFHVTTTDHHAGELESDDWSVLIS